MKKVCCYCETWASGGIESFITTVFSHMEKTDLNVVLCMSKHTNSIYDTAVDSMGIPRHVLTHFDSHNAGLRMFRSIPAFYKEIKRERYDVLHLNIYQGTALVFAWIAKRAKVPLVIVHSHNNGLRKSKTDRIKLLLHKLFRRVFSGCADRYWACSGSAAEFMFSVPHAKRAELIPNGIDIRKFAFDPDKRRKIRESLQVSDACLLGHIGRLCFQKNQAFLIDVLQEMKQRKRSVKLLLVGEGEDRAALAQAASEQHLQDDIIFYGASDDVTGPLCAMDVFLFPSRFEGLGIAAIEAQAAGLPVLCSEYVPQEAGATDSVSFLPLQPERWADRLEQMDYGVRIHAAEKLKAGGYDIKDVAQMIRTAYLGG